MCVTSFGCPWKLGSTEKVGPTELRIQLNEGSRQTARARKIRALKCSSAAKVRATAEGDVHLHKWWNWVRNKRDKRTYETQTCMLESESACCRVALPLIDHPLFSVAMSFGLSQRTKTVRQCLKVPLYMNSSSSSRGASNRICITISRLLQLSLSLTVYVQHHGVSLSFRYEIWCPTKLTVRLTNRYD